MLDAAQTSTDTHAARGGVNTLPADHRWTDTQGPPVGGNPLPAATVATETNERPPLATPMDTQGSAHDAVLRILADALDDLERTRIATENRLRSLGQIKGLADSREADTMHLIADALGALEHKATLDLQRAMRAHPLGPWVKRTVGIGEKQGARLLAAIGDPYIKPAMYDEHDNLVAHARPRLVSELWQYCGHGAPSKRARGVKSWWNPTAKMRLHLIAERCITKTGEPDKNGKPTPLSPYRTVYDEARMDWADRDTSDGHRHNHALRMVGKAILLDLWREAKA